MGEPKECELHLEPVGNEWKVTVNGEGMLFESYVDAIIWGEKKRKAYKNAANSADVEK